MNLNSIVAAWLYFIIITDLVAAVDVNCTAMEGNFYSAENNSTEKSSDCDQNTSLSNFSETIGTGSSAKSVEGELLANDKIKPAIFPIDLIHSRLRPYYTLREEANERLGLTFATDYTALIQHASFTKSDEDTASGHVFRFYGTWLGFGDRKSAMGNLVWKAEVRSSIFGNPTPRDMGFDTGSALSTANYKSEDWGFTDMYWKQRFEGGRYSFILGHMDPGDWADQYPLLNAWTSFLNDAFYNNPTEAIPSRGFGLVGQVYFSDRFYVMGGVHDANGKGAELDFESFAKTNEYFSWAEIGYKESSSVSANQNTHLHIWHQDRREEKNIEESWGLTSTYSVVTQRGGIAFLRAGYSEGDAPQMRRFVGGGFSYKPFGRDTLGIATSWGSPVEKSLRNQITSEIFYRVQFTQNLTISPDFQLINKPSYTPEKNWINIIGLRMRLVF